jgi:hypothetical protein
MAKKISLKTLKKAWVNWFFWHGCSQQAETMLGMSFRPVHGSGHRRALRQQGGKGGSAEEAYHLIQYGAAGGIHL